MTAADAEQAYAMAARILARERGDLCKRLREGIAPLRNLPVEALPPELRSKHVEILQQQLPELNSVEEAIALTRVAEEILAIHDELHHHRP